MIDFEQLKIENQTLHEKIEERNEELAKLKRKKTVTVQVRKQANFRLFFVHLFLKFTRFICIYFYVCAGFYSFIYLS